MFHYHASGDLFLLVHGREPPDDERWDRYIDALGAFDPSGRSAKLLVLTDGGSPTGPQRARLQDVAHHVDRTAVISSAAIPRFAVSMLALIHRNIRSFTPSEFDQATQFVALSPDERRAAVEHVIALKRDGTVGPLRVLDEVLAVARA